MELIRNLTENEFEEMVGEVYFKHIDKYIRLRFDKSIPMDYVHETAEKLNSLSEQTINDIYKYSVFFCRDMLDSYPDAGIDIDVESFDNDSDIMKYMEFEELVIDLPEEDMSRYGINLGGSCKWDTDNGIQWLIKEEKVVYVGGWDDLNIWYSPYEEDDICNYVVRADEFSDF